MVMQSISFCYIAEFVSKKFGLSESSVRQIMTNKIANIVKVKRAKERQEAKAKE